VSVRRKPRASAAPVAGRPKTRALFGCVGEAWHFLCFEGGNHDLGAGALAERLVELGWRKVG
jgi:hypothetical protein